jgi:hypothetical protein
MTDHNHAFLQRLIARLRELESTHVHEHSQALLEMVKKALLDAIAELTLRIEEGRRARDRGKTEPDADPGPRTGPY